MDIAAPARDGGREPVVEIGVGGADWFRKLEGGIRDGRGVIRSSPSGVCALFADVWKDMALSER